MHVEIWSDIACPWCYVGKRRFEAALAGFEHRDGVRLTWRSFELDPQAPRVREQDAAAHLAAKYGTSREQAVAMQDSMTAAAAEEGLAFRFDIARGGNTFDAHRLLHLAAANGCEPELKERLFRAYLGEGEAMGDPAVLERLACEVGLPRDAVRELLAGERYAGEVRDDERTAASLGISAVPFFVLDRTMGASGAHPPEVLGDLLQRGWDARASLSSAASHGGRGSDVEGT